MLVDFWWAGYSTDLVKMAITQSRFTVDDTRAPQTAGLFFSLALWCSLMFPLWSLMFLSLFSLQLHVFYIKSRIWKCPCISEITQSRTQVHSLVSVSTFFDFQHCQGSVVHKLLHPVSARWRMVWTLPALRRITNTFVTVWTGFLVLGILNSHVTMLWSPTVVKLDEALTRKPGLFVIAKSMRVRVVLVMV